MTKIIFYSIEFCIRNQSGRPQFITSKEECDRLKDILQNYNDYELPNTATRLFSFDTVNDGRTVTMNLADVQYVKFLEDFGIPLHNRDDNDNFEDDYIVQIWLRGHDAPFSTPTENAVQVFDLLTDFGYGPETVPYLSIEDFDGDQYYFNASEIVWVSGPSRLFKTGELIAITEAEGN